MKPAIAVQGIFSFVQARNNYFVPSLILKSSLSRFIIRGITLGSVKG